jgi:glutaredoxin-dependent peroxiredoxin
VRTFAISRDSIYSHKAWREVLDLNFPLLSDWNGEAVRAFRIAGDWKCMSDVPVRSAFLVGGDGIIRGAWRYEASEVPDFDVLLDAARSLS